MKLFIINPKSKKVSYGKNSNTIFRGFGIHSKTSITSPKIFFTTAKRNYIMILILRKDTYAGIAMQGEVKTHFTSYFPNLLFQNQFRSFDHSEK